MTQQVFYVNVTVKVTAQDPADALNRVKANVETPDGRDGGACRVTAVGRITPASDYR